MDGANVFVRIVWMEVLEYLVAVGEIDRLRRKVNRDAIGGNEVEVWREPGTADEGVRHIDGVHGFHLRRDREREPAVTWSDLHESSVRGEERAEQPQLRLNRPLALDAVL